MSSGKCRLDSQTGPYKMVLLSKFVTVEYDAVSLKDLEMQSCQCLEVLRFTMPFSANKSHKTFVT